MPTSIIRLCALSLLLTCVACSPAAMPAATPALTEQVAAVTAPRAQKFVAEGNASWYGPNFAGRLTANGEIFDPSQLTAAHKTLAFDSIVKVTNLNNGLSVIVRINDRGPFKPNRIIDLSRAAAEKIGMISSGIAAVRIESITAEEDQSLIAAIDPNLSGYSVATSAYPLGALLLLNSSLTSAPVMVRVVSTVLPEKRNADLLVSEELYASVGAQVTVIEEP